MTQRLRWTDALCLALAVYLATLAWWQITVEQHDFTLDGWLISYSGGAVRRGLTGSLVLALSEMSGLSPRFIVLGLVLAVTAVLLGAVAILLRPVSANPAAWAILVSPAIFLFPTFDPEGAFRKEILLYAALAASLMACSRNRADVGVPIFAASAPVIVLAHEGLAVYLPYGLAMLGLTTLCRRQVIWVAAGAAASGAALLFALAYPGSAAHVDAICRELAAWSDLRRAETCPGISAIGWLAHGREMPDLFRGEARDELVAWILPAVLLSALATAPALWQLRHCSKVLGWLMTSALLSMLASIGLFLVAVDWGRFVHIHATCLGLVCLAALGTKRHMGPDLRPAGRIVWAAVVAIYATTWHLHHYRQPFIPASGLVHWSELADKVRAHFSPLPESR